MDNERNFALRELIDLMEDAVERESTRDELSMLERVKRMQSYVLDTSSVLRLTARSETKMELETFHEFRYAKQRLLTYLVYIDRLVKYFSGDRHSLSDLNSLYPDADFFDWREANLVAMKLYRTFRHQYPDNQVIPLPERIGT